MRNHFLLRLFPLLCLVVSGIDWQCLVFELNSPPAFVCFLALMRIAASSITRTQLVITFCHHSALNVSTGREGGTLSAIWNSNSGSHEVWPVWVSQLLAAHTHGGCNYMADTQSMEIVGDPSCSSGGSVGERKTQQSSITHPVITVRGSGGASRHNAISHGVSTKQKPKLVRIQNYTFHQPR